MDLNTYTFENKIYNGQVKWFNDKNGYGFITFIDDDLKGNNIFVHHSSIKPKISQYKSLIMGEYVSFRVNKNDKGPQASDVSGFGGGTLMIDYSSYNKNVKVVE